MFDAYCPCCSRRRLVFASQVTGVRNDDAGIHVDYRCWCGSAAVWTTGRRAARPAPEPAVQAA